jgi:radical SAM superfamily enzyme YgiQ (UPF0313 family)
MMGYYPRSMFGNKNLMRNLYLFQPQYSVEFHGQKNYWLPYSIGSLWSYLNQFDDIKQNYRLAELGYKRENQDAVIARMENPAVCGFSCYVWNERYCLDLAEKIKQQWPDCVIVFGGPQAHAGTLDHKFIDTVVYGEGERSFLKILKQVAAGDQVEVIYPKDRIDELDFPSPYLEGVFDDIIKSEPDATWQAALETNRGCPYSCTFCDWGSAIYSKVRKFDLTRVSEEIEWMAKNNVSYIFVADANFGILKDRDLEIARMLKEAVDHPESKLESLNIQFAKNSTEVVFEIGKILGDSLKGLTFSVQSMNDETLEAIKRKNMEINKFSTLLEMGAKYGASTYTDMILGMPHETVDTWKAGLAELLEVGQHQSIDVWFTQLLPNSELAQFASRQKYKISSIHAKNYTSIYNSEDDHAETIELINGTKTMSTDDMVDSYLYGWMIVQFHIPGYSQLLSKYSRNVLNLSYAEFYNCLYEIIKTDQLFGPMYEELKRIVSTYLYTGEIVTDDASLRGHALHHFASKQIYDNRERIVDLVGQFVDIPDNIKDLQRCFIANTSNNNSIIIDSEYDIDTWARKSIVYQVDTRIPYNENFDFWNHRRRGLLKNKFTIIERKS